jgi:UDP-3-O-[3-hydroxymyristoyl] glucosamine N-acyltransferase
MADDRFFKNAGAISAESIATLTGAVITQRSGGSIDNSRLFTNVAPLDRATESDISFLDNVKYIDSFTQSNAGACFVRPKYTERAPDNMVLLVTDEPYYAYALTARHFYPDPEMVPTVSPQAVIDSSATIGKACRIDAGAVIKEHVKIGDHCWIGANTVVDSHVEIGSHSRIGANCTLSHTIIGQHVITHRGVHIGQDGFGFAASRRGVVKVPQIGRVLIGDDVEIGSGTCIDRGAGPDTVIGQGCKIDNLVQIGHNVHIGKYVIIVAQCGIAGSSHIGDGVMLGGQVGIAGHVRVGAGARIAAQSGVMTDIPAGATYGGSPAVPARDWHRQTVAMAKIAKKDTTAEE